MSNYTLAVNWAGKNGLSDSDAAKVISGSDFNSEFTTVRTAINSKAELNGSATEDFAGDDVTVAGTLTVTGVPTIPTASTGTNTTQAASTAFVTAATGAITAAFINNLVYPVGSIYTNMAVTTNPNTLLGVGTWVRYAQGRVLVGIADSGTFDALNENLGAETGSHQLTINELPAHTHRPFGVQNSFNGQQGITGNQYKSSSLTNTVPLESIGGNAAHSHPVIQPSVTVYMWKRTA